MRTLLVTCIYSLLQNSPVRDGEGEGDAVQIQPQNIKIQLRPSKSSVNCSSKIHGNSGGDFESWKQGWMSDNPNETENIHTPYLGSEYKRQSPSLSSCGLWSRALSLHHYVFYQCRLKSSLGHNWEKKVLPVAHGRSCGFSAGTLGFSITSTHSSAVYGPVLPVVSIDSALHTCRCCHHNNSILPKHNFIDPFWWSFCICRDYIDSYPENNMLHTKA